MGRVLPGSAHADVIFDLTNGRALAVGTMTTPLVITAANGPEMFGVRFRPGRASAFFGIPLDELTDRTIAIPLDAEPFVDGDRITLVERMLMRRLAGADADARIDAAVARIESSRGLVSIEELARALGITRQHLRRRFLERVGIAPKTFARVVRFRNVVARSTRSPNLSWAGLAADFGYSDQSHLIADFRELAGTTPVPFLLSREAGAP